MKAILYIFIILSCSYKIIYANDFNYYSNINAGELNINTSKAYFIKLNNISQDTIDLISFKVSYLYDSLISVKNGIALPQLLNLNSQNSTIYPGEDFYFEVDLSADFLDTISKSNNYLNWRINILYHKYSSDFFDSLNINFQFKVIDKQNLIFIPNKSYDYLKFYLKSFGKDTLYDIYTSPLYNFTGRDITIDSIKRTYFGKNFYDYFITDSNNDINNKLTLPFIMHNFNHNYINVLSTPLAPEISQCEVKIFGHFNDNNELISLSDTVINKYGIIHNFELYYSLKKIISQQYISDSSNIGYCHIFNSTNTKWFLNDIGYDIPQNSFLKIINNKPFPILIDSNNYTYISDIKYMSKTSGDNLIRFHYEFANENGTKFTYRYIYHINVIAKTEIPILIIKNSDFNIFPNPVTDFINIYFENYKPYTIISIYSIEGIEVLETEFKDKIDVSGFSPGVYYIKINDKVCRFIKI